MMKLSSLLLLVILFSGCREEAVAVKKQPLSDLSGIPAYEAWDGIPVLDEAEEAKAEEAYEYSPDILNYSGVKDYRNPWNGITETIND